MSKLTFSLTPSIVEGEHRQERPSFDDIDEWFRSHEDESNQGVYCKGVVPEKQTSGTHHKKTDSGVIFKICRLDDNPEDGDETPTTTTRSFFEEMKYAKIASANKLGPLVHDAWVAESSGVRKKYGVIEMQLLLKKDQLYKRFQVSNANTQHNKAKSSPEQTKNKTTWIDDKFTTAMRIALQTMWDTCKFVHMDLHQENIFYTTDEEPSRVYFIDYGLVLPFEKVIHLEQCPISWPPNGSGTKVLLASLPYALYTSLYDVHQQLHTLVYEQKGYTYHSLSESQYHTCIAVLYGYALNCVWVSKLVSGPCVSK